MLSDTSPLVWSEWGSTACQICWRSGILIAFLVQDVVGEVCLSEVSLHPVESRWDE